MEIFAQNHVWPYLGFVLLLSSCWVIIAETFEWLVGYRPVSHQCTPCCLFGWLDGEIGTILKSFWIAFIPILYLIWFLLNFNVPNPDIYWLYCPKYRNPINDNIRDGSHFPRKHRENWCHRIISLHLQYKLKFTYM